MAGDFMKAIPVDEYPYVIEHAQEHLEEPDPTSRASSTSGST